jgi:hypothetical protein
MSAVLTPSIYPDREYLKGLIGSILKDDPEYLKGLIKSLFKEEIRNIIHEVADEIIVREYEITKRLAGVEQVTGVANHELEGEKHKVTHEERLRALENKKIQQVNFLQSVTDYRTHFLVRHLETSVTANNFSEIFIDKKEFSHFMNNALPEEYRVTDGVNLRKIMRDVFLKAVAQYPEKVSLVKSNHGNKELRLVLKCNQVEPQ